MWAGLFYGLLAGLTACEGPDVVPSDQKQAYQKQAEALYARARPYFNSGNDTLDLIASKLIVLGLAHADTEVLVQGKMLKANYALRSSNYPVAMKTALEALEWAQQKQLFHQQIDAYGIIGNAYKENEYYQGAFDAGEKALAVARQIKDTFEIIGALLDYGMFTHSYSMLKDNDSIAAVSLALYRQGLALAQSNPRFEQREIPFLDNISQYYMLQKADEKGIAYGQAGARLAKKYRRKRSLTYSFNWLGVMYYRQGQHQKGLAYLDSALQFTRELHWAFREAEVLGDLYGCYRSSGDAAKALSYFTQSQHIRDSLQMLKNLQQVNHLQVQYEAGKKDQEIASLSRLNRQKSRLSYAILGGLTLFVLLSLFLFLQYRTIKARNHLLKQSNEKIQRQSEKLKLLMRELHHRVKNNLQIVSSLLSLQSNHLADQQALQAVRTGQQRIDAMSLIHRSLYQEENDNPNMVRMQAYVPALAENVMQSFGRSGAQVRLQVQVTVNELDVDLALPLGLIINEWLTNAFKYAFDEVPCPELSLKLLRQQQEIVLDILDNGPGMDRLAWEQPQGSFGIKLIKVLSRQLDGTCEMNNTSGTRLRLHLPVKAPPMAV